jgi:aspartyl protease family protein
MSLKRIYQLQRSGNLLWLKAVVMGNSREPRLVRLLVDTGSSYTVLPLSVIEEIGCPISLQSQKISIMAAGGIVQAPIVIVPEFNCLGQQVSNFSAIAMNIPFNPLVNGLLGMDFLVRFRAVIDVVRASIVIQTD